MLKTLKQLHRSLLSLLKRPKLPDHNTFTIRQTLPMRYADTDVLESQLNELLGEDGWESQGMVGQQYVLGLKRELTSEEIARIEEAIRRHYWRFSQESDCI